MVVHLYIHLSYQNSLSIYYNNTFICGYLFLPFTKKINTSTKSWGCSWLRRVKFPYLWPPHTLLSRLGAAARCPQCSGPGAPPLQTPGSCHCLICRRDSSHHQLEALPHHQCLLGSLQIFGTMRHTDIIFSKFKIGLFNFRRHLDQLLLCILTCASRWLSLKHPLETNSCWQHVTLTSCQHVHLKKKFKDTQNTL